MIDATAIHDMETLACQIRKDVIWSIFHARSGHPGGALSCVDLLTVLFHRVLRPPVVRADSYSDDYFILSKGHAAPALYAVAASRQLLPRRELKTLRKLGSRLQGHPDVSQLALVEVSTGSLGQGVSFAAGVARAALFKGSAERIYALVGDGELQEGQVWEMAMFAAHQRLHNLTVLVDYNKLQSDSRNSEVCNLEPLADKWRAFGWQVTEIDGHDIAAIDAALQAASSAPQAGAPSVIIAHTIKGKGVDFMENIPLWHGSVTMTEEQYLNALRALGCQAGDIEEYANV